MSGQEIERLIRALMRSNVRVSYEYAVVTTVLGTGTFQVFTTEGAELRTAGSLGADTVAQGLARIFTELSQQGWDVCDSGALKGRFSAPGQDAWLIRRAVVTEDAQAAL